LLAWVAFENGEVVGRFAVHGIHNAINAENIQRPERRPENKGTPRRPRDVKALTGGGQT
jgi:hypothetical protein